MSADTNVETNSGSYTALTSSSTGYAMVTNPKDSGDNLLVFNGASAPAAFVTTSVTLEPGESYIRTSDMSGHFYGKNECRDSIQVVVNQ